MRWWWWREAEGIGELTTAPVNDPGGWVAELPSPEGVDMATSELGSCTRAILNSGFKSRIPRYYSLFRYTPYIVSLWMYKSKLDPTMNHDMEVWYTLFYIISILASQFHSCFCVRISVTIIIVLWPLLSTSSCLTAAQQPAADQTDLGRANGHAARSHLLNFSPSLTESLIVVNLTYTNLTQLSFARQKSWTSQASVFRRSVVGCRMQGCGNRDGRQRW